MTYQPDATGQIDTEYVLRQLRRIATEIGPAGLALTLQPRTNLEIAAGITPVNYAYPEFNVRRYGAKGDGVADDTNAFIYAIRVAKQSSIGGIITVPPGDYLITSTLALNANHLHMRGAGIWATRLIFAPTGADTLIEVGATGLGDRTYQCSIWDMMLYSFDSTYTKVAIDIIDVSDFRIRDVAIFGSPVVGSAHFWSGNSASVGIRCRGREASSLGPLWIFADRPIEVKDNPSNSIDIDHFRFHDLVLAAASNPHVSIDSGINLTNVIFDGFQSWNLGTDGLYWVDVGTSQASSRLLLKNIRWEQGPSDTSKYLVRIEHNYELQGLVIDNCFGGLDRSGFKLRNCTNVTMRDSHYLGGSTYTCLDIDSTVKRFRADNVFWQTSSTATIAGQRYVFSGARHLTAAPLPTDFILEASANSDANVYLAEAGAISTPSLTIANNGTADIGSTATAGVLIITSDSGNEVAIYSLNGSTHTTTEIFDSGGFYTNAVGGASSTNIYWNAGTSTYRIQNLRGASRDYRYAIVGSLAAF